MLNFGYGKDHGKYAKESGDFAQQAAEDAINAAQDIENAKNGALNATESANTAATNANEAAGNADNKVAELATYDERVEDIETELVDVRQSTVKGKTFATLDERLEEQEADTFIPMTNVLKNADFGQQNTNWSRLRVVNDTYSDGKVTWSNETTGTSGYAQDVTLPVGNILYSRFKFTTQSARRVLVNHYESGSYNSFTDVPATSMMHFDNTFSAGTHIVSSILKSTKLNSRMVFLVYDQAAGTVTLERPVFIDLTATFGKGSEPTKEEMDRLLAKYPNSFFDGTVNLTPKLLDDLRYLTSDVNMPMRNEIVNGDFSQGTTGWSSLHGSLTVVDSQTVQVTGSGGAYEPAIYRNLAHPPGAGEKIYAKYRVRSIDDGCTELRMIAGNVSKPSGIAVTNPTKDTWYEIATIVNASGSYGLMTMYAVYPTSAEALGKRSEYRLVTAINLTQVFGAGNEPTKAQMDALLAIYPNSWFDGTVNLAENKRIIPFLLKRLELKADKAQEAWITPTFANGYTGDLKFCKNQFGDVIFKGGVIAGTFNQTIFTLPTGYRPAITTYIPASTSSTEIQTLLIGNTGVVRMQNAHSLIKLDGLRFSTL